MVTIADNQESFITELDRDGHISWVGRKEDISGPLLQKSLVHEIKKLKTQGRLSSPHILVDGLGALRVSEMIFPSEKKHLKLRKACQEDTELFYGWVNDPLVRQNSFQQKPISWKEHVDWFNSRLESRLTSTWVMQTSFGLPVGQVRFDFDLDVANISFSLDSIARGRGWGVMLVEMGIEEICGSTKVSLVQGKVKLNNPASRKIFNKLGFSEEIVDDVITFRKKINDQYCPENNINSS